MTEAFTVRPLQLGDPPAIEALYAACMATERAIGPVSAAQWSAAIALPQFGGGRDFLVAEQRGAVIGLAESSLRDQGARWLRHLKILVDPGWRRRKVGTALLAAVLDQAPLGEPLTLQSNVSPDWTAAIAFLEEFGFTPIETEITMRCTTLRPLPKTAPGMCVFRPSDPDAFAEQVAQVHNQSFCDDAGFTVWTPQDAKSHIEHSHLWIAASAGALVGFALIESDLTQSWLEAIAVRPDWRGRGLGGALATKAFGGDGVVAGRPAGLSVSSRNAAALRLYQRLGFSARSEKRKYAAQRAEIRNRISVARQ